MLQRTILRKTWEKPVPTHREVNLLLELLPDGSATKVALGLVMIGLRPIEVANLKWSAFEWNKDKTKLLSITHLMYKPTNRITASSINTYYKLIKKEWISDWLQEQIKLYAKSSPQYKNNKVFAFSTPDSLNKWFSKIRKKYKKDPKYSFLQDKNFEVLEKSDTSLTRYRISLYSLRRFGLTFMYYVNFNQDVLKTSKYSGHSRPKTLLDHYLMPRESIGLTQDMLKENISFDNFIKIRLNYQKSIEDYQETPVNRFLESGQTQLLNFT